MLVFNMSEINILYAFDSRFWKLAATSMHSLLTNKKPDTKYTIYCMVAPHTSGKRQISKMISIFSGAGLVWHTVKKSENPFQSYDYSRWSPVIFYRLIAARIFPHIDKILYLDSDTLVCSDLSELFNTDISNYALGAVRDMAPTEDADNPNGKYVRDFSDTHLSGGPYFNSGVLLLNLKNMAKNEKLLLTVKVPLKYPDQDILNVALRDKIRPLALKYNFAPGVKISKNFTGRDRTADKNYTILHFYTIKPYYYQYIPHDIYTLFYKHCTALGIYPDDFIADENKHRRHNRQSPRTNIPFLRIHNNTIRLFGIKIVDL